MKVTLSGGRTAIINLSLEVPVLVRHLHGPLRTGKKRPQTPIVIFPTICPSGDVGEVEYWGGGQMNTGNLGNLLSRSDRMSFEVAKGIISSHAMPTPLGKLLVVVERANKAMHAIREAAAAQNGEGSK